MADRRSRTTRSAASRATARWRTYAAGIAAVLALILIFQNSQKVEFKFFFVDDTPLFFG